MNEPPKPSGTELLQTLIAVQKRNTEILAQMERNVDRLVGIGYYVRSCLVSMAIGAVILLVTEIVLKQRY
jgi:hypothetical protein